MAFVCDIFLKVLIPRTPYPLKTNTGEQVQALPCEHKVHHIADRERVGLLAFCRHHPPRPEANQHCHHKRGRRETAGFWARTPASHQHDQEVHGRVVVPSS